MIIQIFQGNALDILARIDTPLDGVITDPPYALGSTVGGVGKQKPSEKYTKTKKNSPCPHLRGAFGRAAVGRGRKENRINRQPPDALKKIASGGCFFEKIF